MADKTKDIQENGIVFGDWKLFPVDSINWELCHRHEVSRGKNAGTVKWVRLGRFYSWNTFKNALMYAADYELREGSRETATDIGGALNKYLDITEKFLADLKEALG